MLRRLSFFVLIILILLVFTPGSALAFSLDNVDGVWINAINSGTTPPTCLRVANTASTTDENIVAYGDTILILSDSMCRAGASPNMTFQSGFGFNGVDGVADFAPGQPFLLGEFKHYNQPLYPNLVMTTAQLRLNLNFVSPLPDATLNYTFRLLETTNFPPIGVPCPFGGNGNGCFDVVSFENAVVQDTFILNGVAYTLQIVGFVEGTAATCTYDESEVLERFITAERATNTACLFGRLLVAQPSIELTKTLNETNPVPYGADVSFTLRLQNTGNILLRNIDLEDEVSTGGGCDTFSGPFDDIDDDRVLAPGEAWTYRCGVNAVTVDFTNFATVEAVAFVNNGTITVTDADQASVIVTQNGQLVVTKSVNWRGAAPFTVEFEICVRGPSYPDSLCDLYSPEETIVYNNLIPGSYTIIETNPGAAWWVQNSPGAATVEANRTTFAMVINTLQRGSLTVDKIVQWGSATPIADIAFTICIAGPSYPAGTEGGACQVIVGAAGGQLTWGDLLPGSYTLRETSLGQDGQEWTVTYAPEVVTVPAGGSAFATVTNTNGGDPLCEARDLRIDLSGRITIDGSTAIGSVTNNGEARCEYLIGMASYRKYNEVIDDQEIFAWVNPTVSIASGETVTLNVGLPPCAAQVDLFYGEYLPNLVGVRYGPRLLAAVHIGGENYCIDTDGDGIFNALDPDDDNDGLLDEVDGEPLVFNDMDSDGIGDGFDDDIDGDGLLNSVDAAPLAFNDLDGDGIGDGSDDDIDGDGLPNDTDPEPLTFNDHDGDGMGDGADSDDDNDGLLDEADAEPLVFNDMDNDGIGDGNDDDIDGDGFLNEEEITAGTSPTDPASYPAPVIPPAPPSIEGTPESTSPPN